VKLIGLEEKAEKFVDEVTDLVVRYLQSQIGDEAMIVLFCESSRRPDADR